MQSLPGWGRLSTRLYSGEVPISKHKAMFYALVEADCRRPEDVPVVLWLTGWVGVRRGTAWAYDPVCAGCTALPGVMRQIAPCHPCSPPATGPCPAAPPTSLPRLPGTAHQRACASYAPPPLRSGPGGWSPLAYYPAGPSTHAQGVPFFLALFRSGPGCSSVGTAFIGEHGPFFPRPGSTSQLMENPYRQGMLCCDPST